MGGRPRRNLPDPKNPKSVVEHVDGVQRILDQQVSFGHPQDPGDDAGTALAGTTHNGVIYNMEGTWVELRVTVLDANTTCTHNLNLTVLSASQPNCRWLVWGYQHDGTGAGTTSTISCNYEDGTVAADSIQLRFYAVARTVDADHPLKVTLWFIPAVRGIAQP